MTMMTWDSDPRRLENDDPDFRAQVTRCLDVLCGARRWALADYRDDRLCIIAALGDSFRQSGLAPTPLRIASMLRRLGLPDRGALRFIARLQFGDEKLETGT